MVKELDEGLNDKHFQDTLFSVKDKVTSKNNAGNGKACATCMGLWRENTHQPYNILTCIYVSYKKVITIQVKHLTYTILFYWIDILQTTAKVGQYDNYCMHNSTYVATIPSTKLAVSNC